MLGEVLVPAGAAWKYWDTGLPANADWALPGFEDSAWSVGAAPLGYGEDNIATTVSFGPDSDNKIVTTYFRHAFVITNAAQFSRIALRLRCDDGAIVWLNGLEIWRQNLPSGEVGALTLALTNVFGAGEQTYQTADLPFTLLTGTNTLAVEIHQAGSDSIDLFFDLELSAFPAAYLTRGPYLQAGTPNSILIRWRTDAPVDSTVRFGTDPEHLAGLASDATPTTNHQVWLTGLRPDTKYYYGVGAGAQRLAGGLDCHFVTAPLQARPTRIWAIGNAGTGTANQRAVRDAYYALAGERHTDVWLMLGDNAHPRGTDAQYQTALFDMYPALLRQTVAWSCVGNEETYATFDWDHFPYLQLFNPSLNGEAGGVPSGTKKYYSFNYGNIHFVSLDAMTSDRSSNGPMCAWLQQDLAANTNDWIIAFWHHPPYTKGSHDSDNLAGDDYELVEMREHVVPLLEAYGVDLVLSGHSQCYERSYLLRGHYGYSWELEQEMILNPGAGHLDDHSTYVKATNGPAANQGTVYVVVGSSGQATFGTLDHPAMFRSLLGLGSLVLDVDGLTLNARFLRENGAIDDQFTIVKGDQPGHFRVTDIHRDDGSATVTWNTVPGYIYRLDRRFTLEAEWELASEDMRAPGNLLTWQDYLAPVPHAYYRVEQLGP